ncbi:MAG: antitoxin [Elusimicrobiota bacterium]|jgi:predicted DNA binding CopG/RHH family protein|nr:antitoxin [Elusimicrobiota bacterium]
MKLYKLDKEEKETWKAMYRGDYKTVPNLQEEIKRYASYAKNRKQIKNKNINIRINENDLDIIKNIAKEKGLPYQTYIGSTLHKIAMKHK